MIDILRHRLGPPKFRSFLYRKHKARRHEDQKDLLLKEQVSEAHEVCHREE